MKKLKIARPLIPNNKFMSTIATIVVIAIALTGCTKKQAEELSPKPPGPEEVTVNNVSYTNFAKALFETKCRSCHTAGRPASARWEFNGYNSVKDHITRINNVVLVTKTMPIGGTLTAKEIELLDAWIKRNTPEN